MLMPTLLLVHGAWHGPDSWQPVQEALSARDVQSATVTLPSLGAVSDHPATLQEDADAIAAAAQAIAEDVVIVAHAYAGMPVAQAKFPSNVRRLVFLGAAKPETGRSLVFYLPGAVLPPFVRQRPDGATELDAGAAPTALYADCKPALAQAATARLRPHARSVFDTATTHSSWRRLKTHYVVLMGDRFLGLDLQRSFAARTTKVHEFHSAHAPMISMPVSLAILLALIAGQEQKAAWRRWSQLEERKDSGA
jgi:pimeloyl-ACP methyl ester carboxylesterase